MGVIVLNDLKTYLTVEHSDDDALLSMIVGFVNADVKGATHRAFDGTDSTEERVDGGGDCLILNHLPVTAITKITDTEDESELDADTYEVDANSGLVYLVDHYDWSKGNRRFKVEYTFGYAAPPDDVKTAAYLLGAMYYERRDLAQVRTRQGDTSQDFSAEWPQQVKDILKRYITEYI